MYIPTTTMHSAQSCVGTFQVGKRQGKKVIRMSCGADGRNRDEAKLLCWKKTSSTQGELLELIAKVFPPTYQHSVTCKMMKPRFLPRGADGHLKTRFSVEYRQSTVIEPSADSRFPYYVALCTDRTKVNALISSLKACVARSVLHYTFDLSPPALLTKLLGVQRVSVTSEDLEEVRDISFDIKLNLHRAVKAYQEDLRQNQLRKLNNLAPLDLQQQSNNLNGKGTHLPTREELEDAEADNIRNYSFDEFSALYNKAGMMTCPLCFVQPKGLFFTQFKCGDVVCSKCHQGMDNRVCPTCDTIQIVYKRGVSMTKKEYEDCATILAKKVALGNDQCSITPEAMLQMLHHYQAIVVECVKLAQRRNVKYEEDSQVYTTLLEDEALVHAEKSQQMKSDALNCIKEMKQ